MSRPFVGTPTYRTVHSRLTSQRGRADQHRCSDCGEPAQDWALTGAPKWTDPRPYTDDLTAYEPLCRGCHWTRDRGWKKCPHGPDRDEFPSGGCRECREHYEPLRASRPQVDPDEYDLTIEQVAKTLQVSVNFIKTRTDLPYGLVGGDRRYRADDLNAWLTGQQRGNT